MVAPNEPQLPFLFECGCVRVTIDLRCYRLTAVQKAAYRLADRCTVVLGEQAADSLPIQLTFAPGTSETVACEAARAFFQELLDQELREKIGQETGPLRSLLIAQAFSKTDLIKHDD